MNIRVNYLHNPAHLDNSLPQCNADTEAVLDCDLPHLPKRHAAHDCPRVPVRQKSQSSPRTGFAHRDYTDSARSSAHLSALASVNSSDFVIHLLQPALSI